MLNLFITLGNVFQHYYVFCSMGMYISISVQFNFFSDILQFLWFYSCIVVFNLLCLLSFYATVNGIVFNIFLQIFHCYYLRIYVSGVLTMYSETLVNTFITSNIIFLNALRFSLFKVLLYTNRPSFISSFTNFILFTYFLD